MRPIVPTLVGALIVVGVPSSSRGQEFLLAKPDTTASFHTIITDEKATFRAIGTWSSIDRSDPPNGFSTGVIGPPSLMGTNWFFHLGETIADWRIPPVPNPPKDNGAHHIVLFIVGSHEHGPHDSGSPLDDPSNTLEADGLSAKKNISFIIPGSITLSNREEHPTDQSPHWDLYSLKRKATAMKGPPHWLEGAFELLAKHTGKKTEQQDPHQLVMGSSPGAGAYVSYDAGGGSLTVHFGALDILNSAGSMTPGIEARFFDDALLNAQFTDLTMLFLGPTGDGGYRFGGGTALLVDPESQLQVEGGTSDYLVYDTSLPGPMNSYALFDSLTIGDGGECISPFLLDFVDVNLFGETLTEAEWLEIQGIGLMFITAQNLAQLTAGFTVSAFNVPATVAMAASRGIQPVGGAPDDHKQESGFLESSRSYPNPTQRGATVEYRLRVEGPVRIEIYDTAGRMVKRLANHPVQPEGEHSALWDGTAEDGSPVAAGLYFYRITAGSQTQGNRIVFAR